MNSRLITTAPFVAVLLVLMGALIYQYYDSSNHRETVTEVKVINIIQQCHKSSCHHIVNTDKGIFSILPHMGNEQGYMNLVAEIKVDKVYTFQTEGKEEHLAYVPFFKKNYREIVNVSTSP